MGRTAWSCCARLTDLATAADRLGDLGLLLARARTRGDCRAALDVDARAGARRATPAASRWHGPSSSSTAGSSTQRTTIASRNTATARPKPNSLSVRSSPSMNERKTQIMIAAAALITRPVSAMPSATARRRVAVADPLLADARDQEHLVVHREAEHDREHEHRDPRLDRALLHAEHARRASPSWKTATVTPSAPPMLSRFISAAWIGITSERKITNSSSAESTITIAMNSGSLPAEHVREVDRAGREPADQRLHAVLALERRQHVVAQVVDEIRSSRPPAAPSRDRPPSPRPCRTARCAAAVTATTSGVVGDRVADRRHGRVVSRAGKLDRRPAAAR